MNVYTVMQETNGSPMSGNRGPAAQAVEPDGKAGHGRQPPV